MNREEMAVKKLFSDNQEDHPEMNGNNYSTLNDSEKDKMKLLWEKDLKFDKFYNCKGKKDFCGPEAACQDLGNYSKCVCPHDLSRPKDDYKCPNRRVVNDPPKPIPIYIIQSDAKITSSSTSIPTSSSSSSSFSSLSSSSSSSSSSSPKINFANNSTSHPEAAQVDGFHYDISNQVIVLTAVTLALMGVLSILYCICKRKCSNKKLERTTPDLSPINLKKSILLANKYTPNPQYFGCNLPDVPIIRRNQLIFINDIGEGYFGKVFKGELVDGSRKEIVAVKVLKDSASKEAEEDFMREVEIMLSFTHENILSLIGVVLRDSTNCPWMVFEYMPHGDLADVLRSHARHSTTLHLTKNDLYRISVQIASGMAYLSAQRFVHRDLACRNCLVGSNLVVKIADFGMSRDVYISDYYKIGGSKILPVRWMSPECIVYGRFTLESDIWSFGIVLWEIYTYGKLPYYGYNNEEVVNFILQGVMLTPPDDCPLFATEIMKQCWKIEPRNRPQFSDILDKLEKIYERLENNNSIDNLPRPPQGPITIKPSNILDSEGYLVPAPTLPQEYLQPLPPILMV